MNIRKKLESLTPVLLTLAIEHGVTTTMTQYQDPLFKKGLEMFKKDEMSKWQFTKFCQRHNFLMF